MLGDCMAFLYTGYKYFEKANTKKKIWEVYFAIIENVNESVL